MFLQRFSAFGCLSKWMAFIVILCIYSFHPNQVYFLQQAIFFFFSQMNNALLPEPLISSCLIIQMWKINMQINISINWFSVFEFFVMYLLLFLKWLMQRSGVPGRDQLSGFMSEPQERGEHWELWPEWRNEDTWWGNVHRWKRGFLRIMIFACFLLPTESKSFSSALWDGLTVEIKICIV